LILPMPGHETSFKPADLIGHNVQLVGQNQNRRLGHVR
jgi:hypothetical protein